ncbi:hypothetical protein STRIP9103_09573, partial [Streptomyces ipomoeae 91-03]|jgi:hypothetical protein
MDHQ